MGIEKGFTFVTDIINGISIAGIEIMPILIPIISLILITRDLEKWKRMAFPIFLLWKVAGLNVPYYILLGTGFILTLSLFEKANIGELLSSISTKIEQKTNPFKINKQNIIKNTIKDRERTITKAYQKGLISNLDIFDKQNRKTNNKDLSDTLKLKESYWNKFNNKIKKEKSIKFKKKVNK